MRGGGTTWMTLLARKSEKPRSSRPRRPAKNPDAPLKEGGELETGEKSGIRPRIFPRIYDRPPRLTHTHTSNTTYTNYIVIVRIIATKVRNKLDY